MIFPPQGQLKLTSYTKSQWREDSLRHFQGKEEEERFFAPEKIMRDITFAVFFFFSSSWLWLLFLAISLFPAFL